MATVARPKQPQYMVALAEANRTRLAAARVKRDVKAGRITIAQALVDPDAKCIKIIDLLSAQQRWGRRRSLKCLTPLGISELRRVCALTERQRKVLAEALNPEAGR